jgi:hypothetical protein
MPVKSNDICASFTKYLFRKTPQPPRVRRHSHIPARMHEIEPKCNEFVQNEKKKIPYVEFRAEKEVQGSPNAKEKGTPSQNIARIAKTTQNWEKL